MSEKKDISLYSAAGTTAIFKKVVGSPVPKPAPSTPEPLDLSVTPSVERDLFWIGRKLLAEGEISRDQLLKACETHRQRGAHKPFSETLELLQLVAPQRVAKLVAEHYFPGQQVYLEKFKCDRAVARRVSRSRTMEKLFVAFGEESGVVQIAHADPALYSRADASLDFPTASEIELWVTPRQEVLTALEEVWSAPVTVENPADYARKTILDLIEERATDAHFETKEASVVIRKRIDGKLYVHENITKGDGGNVIQTIQTITNLDITEPKPQDGRFKIKQGARVYTCRVHSSGMIYGKNLNIRFFLDAQVARSLSELGMYPDQIAKLVPHLAKLHGGIFATGPMGSGKSTLQRAMVQTLPLHEIKVLTIEDPPEQEIPSINQMAIDPQKGITFPVALKSALRQDGDVLVIGELRDKETAEIAIKGALAGTLLFTTLHTNSAPSAVTRLVEIGIEPFVIPSAVSVIIATRLVRRLCVECKRISPHSDALKKQYGMVDGEICEANPNGCKECKGGYNGRIGLFEILTLQGNEGTLDEEMRGVILAMGNKESTATEADLMPLARASGMRTLREDGLKKIAAGVTSFEEVLRET